MKSEEGESLLANWSRQIWYSLRLVFVIIYPGNLIHSGSASSDDTEHLNRESSILKIISITVLHTQRLTNFACSTKTGRNHLHATFITTLNCLYIPVLFHQRYFCTKLLYSVAVVISWWTYTMKNRPLYIDIVGNLDCTSSPGTYSWEPIVERIENKIHHHEPEFPVRRDIKLLTKANLNNITFKNTLSIMKQLDHLFDIDDHWRNVKFIDRNHRCTIQPAVLFTW